MLLMSLFYQLPTGCWGREVWVRGWGPRRSISMKCGFTALQKWIYHSFMKSKFIYRLILHTENQYLNLYCNAMSDPYGQDVYHLCNHNSIWQQTRNNWAIMVGFLISLKAQISFQRRKRFWYSVALAFQIIKMKLWMKVSSSLSWIIPWIVHIQLANFFQTLQTLQAHKPFLRNLRRAQ